MKDPTLLLPLHTSREHVVPDGNNAQNLGENKVLRYGPAGWDMMSQDLSGMSISALQNLIQNGVGSSAADKSRSSQANHGHMYMRKCSDLMRAKNEQLVASVIKKVFNANPTKKFLLVNVGAKLGQDTKRWNKMWGLPRDNYGNFPFIHTVHIRPEDEEAGNEHNWASAGLKPSTSTTWTNIRHTVGGEEEADQIIYEKRFRQDLFKGTLEEWVEKTDGTWSEYQIFIMMNDCHYYFPKPLPQTKDFENAILYVSGLNFSPIPGKYKLPDNNGDWTVYRGMDGYLKIDFRPYLNGTPYKHDWVFVPEPVMSINAGWIQHFATDLVWRKWCPMRLTNPTIDVQKLYPQVDVLSQQAESLSGTEWKRYFFANSWAENKEPVPYRNLGQWMLSQLTPQTSVGKARLLLRTLNIDSNHAQYVWLHRDRLRQKLVSTSVTTSWILDSIRSVRYQSFDELGGIQVAGWDAKKAPDWNEQWMSWKEYTALLKSECKTKTATQREKIQSKSWSKVEEYYEIKPTSPDDIRPNRAYVSLGSDKEDQDWISHLQRYVKKMLETAAPRTVRKTQHGPKLLGQKGEQQSYEWCSKSPINLVYALFNRQMKSRLSPDPTVMREFADWFRRWFDEKFEKLRDTIPTITPWQDYINGQSTWNESKKAKYTETFVKQSSQHTFKTKDWIYAFSAMVKSGEVYFRAGEAIRDMWNCLTGRSDRPRLIFVPSANACGPLTWIQQFMFKDIKHIIPGFIQGMTCAQMKEVIKSNMPHDARCCSSDGSSFDSHQHFEIMEAVDSYVWTKFSDRILQVLSNHFKYPDVMHKGIMWQALQHETTLFFQLAGIDSLEGSKFAANDEVRKFFPVQGKDWRQVRIKGTTFSGQPVKTTLGNTMRSLAYHEFMCYKAGIPEENKFVIASGDDVCVWISEQYVPHYQAAVKKYTHDGTDEISKGLGQCIKELIVGEWWQMDFCSKKCFFKDGKWIISRNASKVWNEKMEYVGKLELFHKQPEQHLMAMADSAAAELKSPLIQEFFVERLKRILERLRTDPATHVRGYPDFQRIRGIQNWISGEEDSYSKKARLDMWISSCNRRSWIFDEDQLPTEADVSFFTEAGWDLLSFVQFYGGDDFVTLA